MASNNGVEGVSDPAELTTIEPVSRPEQRAAARTRRASYPYNFPRDSRKLGGKYSVEENARILQRFFYLERRLSHALGSWTLSIPDFEVKVETGRHIFYHIEAARIFRGRLNEQEKRQPGIDQFRDSEIDLFIDEMLSATDVPELLVGVHQVAGRELQKAYRHHIDNTCPVADAPTIRLLRQILVDYDEMLAWSDGAIAAYIDGGIEETRLEAWRWHLARLLRSIGGVTGLDLKKPQPTPLRVHTRPYERGVVPTRDSRFETFSNTGDYNVADVTHRYPVGTYEDKRLHFVRAQRDEVDAIEAFGTFLWDIRFMDFDAEYALARITWDETRHTEMGHRMLQAMGYDPFELPNRMTTSTCRGPMEPAYAMAEINLFGEVGVLKTIGDFIGEAQRRDDAVLVHGADFIRSDERTHVRKGQHILSVMTDLGMQELETRTRELFTECLVSLGALNKDTDLFTLSREDIIRLVGE